MNVTEKKAIVGFATFVVGLLFLRRAFAKGDVFIDKVTVEKAEYTPEDAAQNVLASLQRKAMEDLGVDLDLMAPTRKPSPLQTLEVEGTIGKLRAAGRSGEAGFLTQLLREAQAIGQEES